MLWRTNAVSKALNTAESPLIRACWAVCVCGGATREEKKLPICQAATILVQVQEAYVFWCATGLYGLRALCKGGQKFVSRKFLELF